MLLKQTDIVLTFSHRIGSGLSPAYAEDDQFFLYVALDSLDSVSTRTVLQTKLITLIKQLSLSIDFYIASGLSLYDFMRRPTVLSYAKTDCLMYITLSSYTTARAVRKTKSC